MKLTPGHTASFLFPFVCLFLPLLSWLAVPTTFCLANALYAESNDQCYCIKILLPTWFIDLLLLTENVARNLRERGIASLYYRRQKKCLLSLTCNSPPEERRRRKYGPRLSRCKVHFPLKVERRKEKGGEKIGCGKERERRKSASGS